MNKISYTNLKFNHYILFILLGVGGALIAEDLKMNYVILSSNYE